jgi:hypothetical protein
LEDGHDHAAALFGARPLRRRGGQVRGSAS